MTYVFDTSSFIVLGHYFPKQFPSFWDRLNAAVSAGQALSVREVRNELDYHATRDHLREWIKTNRHIFLSPTPQEMAFVAKIFSVRHFQQLVGEKQRLQGRPVADPFVIAAAAVKGDACVVTEETCKPNAAKIPNVCEHFHIACVSLEGFMAEEGWTF